MRAPFAPSTPQIRFHPAAAAVEVQALYRGIVIDARCLRADDPAPYLIGSADGVDAPAATELLTTAAHPLVSADAAGFAVALTEQMTGAVLFEDRSLPLSELLATEGTQFVAPPAARLQIACGEVAFLVSATAAPPLVPRPATRPRDRWPALVAFAAVFLMMALVSWLPPDAQVLSYDALNKDRLWAASTTIPEVTPPAPRAPGGASAGPATKPTAAAGAPRHTASRRVGHPPRGAAPPDVGHQGLLGVLLGAPGRSWSALFSNDSALRPGSFDDLVDGDPAGQDIGLQATGTGAAPIGPLVGGGQLGRIGGCDAHCQERARQVGRLAAGLPRHLPRVPEVIAIGGVVRGSLDREIVRRIIRRHLNEVKYCYEQQLPRHADLAGRITVQFTIAPAGRVVASLVQSSTVGNIAVESCIVQAVRRWEFPQPAGGGLVMVSYPFVLVPAGAP